MATAPFVMAVDVRQAIDYYAGQPCPAYIAIGVSTHIRWCPTG